MHAGDVVWNPLTGEKAMLVESAKETHSARIVVDFGVEAGGFVPGGEHVLIAVPRTSRSAPAGSRSARWRAARAGGGRTAHGGGRHVASVVQKLLFPPLAAYARRRGLEPTFDRYLDLTTHPWRRQASDGSQSA